MALHGRMLLIVQASLEMVAVVILAAATIAALPQALPGCQEKCGNLTIPYPFGIGKGCSMAGEYFNLTCNTSTVPPTTYWGNVTVTNISLPDAEMQTQQYVSKDCYDTDGQPISNIMAELWMPSPFTISDTKNNLVAIGCDTKVIVEGYRNQTMFATGCTAWCDGLGSVDQGSCSGAGCCETKIPSGLYNQTIQLDSYYNYKFVKDVNACSYAFVVEQDQFKFSKKSFQELSTKEKLPMVVNWAIGYEPEPCDAARKSPHYACKANTTCANRPNQSGYTCRCLEGYHGNPYHPNGCQDIDECAGKNPCTNGKCMNSPGNYSCSCNKGFKNQDPRTCVKHSTADNTTKKVLFAVVGSFGVLLAVVVSLMHYMKRRKVSKLKKEYFERNGGLFLQNQLKRYNGRADTPRLFTDKELQKATNNYHEDKIIGEGTYGIVYQGILEDEKVVAIKQSKLPTSPGQSNQLVHEVIVVAQINHKNVVKLLGCCLETQRPSLVYEYVSNGTLYDHIHKKGGRFRPLSLALRLKIASETAQALSYLHYSSRTPIIHRDVKATNILLDENYVAKVSDFGASKLVPEDQNQVSTLVQGTMGYLDPEYLQSNTLTEKSDVYSFGVVLAELLTSQKAISFQKPEAERNLANLFVSLVKQGRLDRILDAEIVMEGQFETVDKVVDLANRCLSLRGVERPSMKQVAMELEEIISKRRHPASGKANYFTSPKDTDHLLGSPVYIVDLEGNDGGSSGIITSADYDKSLPTQIQMNKHYDNGR
ncbi:unnamed protein product [Prunus brigantina]